MGGEPTCKAVCEVVYRIAGKGGGELNLADLASHRQIKFRQLNHTHDRNRYGHESKFLALSGSMR